MNNGDTLTTTTTGGGAQSTTQNPQVATPDDQTANAQAVQPGTATNLLNSSQGIQLNNTAVTTVSLNNTSSTTVAVPPQKHGINPVLGGLSILLFVLAAGLFYLTARSSKKTTI